MDASPEYSPEIIRDASNVIEEMVVDQILNITTPPEDFSVEEKSLSCLSNPPSFLMAADSTRLDNVVQGSPGSTPFPRVNNKWQPTQDLDGSYIFADPRLDISDSINGSPIRSDKRSKLEISLELPQAPPNTPNAKNLEEEIINIAKREEEKLQLQMKIKGLQNFSEPKPETEEKVEKTTTNADESNLEHAPIIASPSEREMNRRQRMVNGVTKLKAMIPGLTPQSNEMEVLERTYRYIEFLRRFVDVKHDETFLQNQIL